MRVEDVVAGGPPGKPEPSFDPNAPLFSLSLGEGAGSLLAAAAGDVAGGADPAGYSAVTQSAIVLAYHLFQVDEVDRDGLAAELLDLDRTEDGVRCYRGESPSFRAWLDSARSGEPRPSGARSAEPAARIGPVGVWFRREPERLVEAALAASRLTHLDAATAAAAAAVAGAVAGSCFAQSGIDLVTGAAETAERALAEMETSRFAAVDDARDVPRRLRSLAPAVNGDIRSIVDAAGRGDGVERALLGVLLGASKLNDPIALIEAAAVAGGSEAGAVAGSIVGARSGLIRWPWKVPNETWFAEIGRRLVERRREVRDLPVPFAVEERMTLAVRNLPSNENP